MKIGMVATAPIASTIADRLRHHGARNIVLDPVMVAKSGDRLLRPDAVEAIRSELVPLSTVLTPNLPEAGLLLNAEPNWTREEMRRRIADLHRLGPQWVLLKGGHLRDDEESTDLLLGEGEVIDLRAPRVVTTNDHGTGCTLSAAIASMLPRHTVEESVGRAKSYVHRSLTASGRLKVGQGHGPLHHFHALW